MPVYAHVRRGGCFCLASDAKVTVSSLHAALLQPAHLQNVCIHIYTHMHKHVHVHEKLFMYVCICISVYVYLHMYICILERLSKLLVHGQTMDDLGGSYRFTRIPSHVSVRYRFALVKVGRPSDSLILLVACPVTALCCPLLLFTAFYCPVPALYCSSLPFTALHLPLTALYCTSLPCTALHCPLLPSTAWGSGS